MSSSSVVGASTTSSTGLFFLDRSTSALYGLMTRKNTTAAMITNDTRAVRKTPMLTLMPGMTTLLKSGWPPIRPMKSMMICVKALTTSPNAAPMMTAVASWTRLPCIRNSLKSFIKNSVPSRR